MHEKCDYRKLHADVDIDRELDNKGEKAKERDNVNYRQSINTCPLMMTIKE